MGVIHLGLEVTQGLVEPGLLDPPVLLEGVHLGHLVDEEVELVEFDHGAVELEQGLQLHRVGLVQHLADLLEEGLVMRA